MTKNILIVESLELNWPKAKAACEAKGMKLLTLPSNDEIPKIAKLIKKDKYYWIGGHCPGSFFKESVTVFNILVTALNFYH